MIFVLIEVAPIDRAFLVAASCLSVKVKRLGLGMLMIELDLVGLEH